MKNKNKGCTRVGEHMGLEQRRLRAEEDTRRIRSKEKDAWYIKKSRVQAENSMQNKRQSSNGDKVEKKMSGRL